MVFPRALLLALAFAFVLTLRGAEQALRSFDQAEVTPCKTSIYVGSVALTVSKFTRSKQTYEGAYTAKVFPYFFYNEDGRLSVEFTDEMLRQLERGESVDFKGRAVRTDGAARGVRGKATPTGPGNGKLKVRVAYSERVELIFNTTYRFPDVAP